MYVIGADVGGSTTRIAVVDDTGTVWSRVQANGANPNAAGPVSSAAVIGAAAREALALAQQRVGHAITPLSMVLGLAGGSRVAGDPAFLDAIAPTATTRTRVVTDLEVAFASAAEVDHGCVLIAGTGAVAGRVASSSVVAVRDGWGWLLGDAGAGFWLGREAVRATLHRLERGAELQSLHRAVLAATGTTERLALVGVCYQEPPLRLAALAPLVNEHASVATETDAQRIATAAARQLAELLLDVADTEEAPGVGGPAVLAGSVATTPGPIAAALRRRLVDGLASGARILEARSGLTGAAWLALNDAVGGMAHDAVGAPGREVHRRLAAALEPPRPNTSTDDADLG